MSIDGKKKLSIHHRGINIIVFTVIAVNTAEKCNVPFKIQGIHIFRCLIVFFLSIQWVILRPFATVTRPIGMCQIILRAPDDSAHLFQAKKNEPQKLRGRGLDKPASPSTAQGRSVWIVLMHFFLCTVKVPCNQNKNTRTQKFLFRKFYSNETHTAWGALKQEQDRTKQDQRKLSYCIRSCVALKYIFKNSWKRKRSVKLNESLQEYKKNLFMRRIKTIISII